MILQIDLTNPTVPVIPADSVHEQMQQALSMLTSDPTTFWTQLAQQALHFGLKVLAALLIYILGMWLIGRVKLLLQKVFERKQTERTLATFITSFASIMMTIILVIVSVGTLGVDTTSLAALLAAGGMAIGMALSGTVQNFAGGIMLLVFQPFKSGDFIEAQGVKGTVMETSIFSTKVLTTDNRMVVLPNGSLSNGVIDNYSAQELRRVEWQVSVEYGCESQPCMDLILQMLSEDERILGSEDKRPQLKKSVGVKLGNAPIPDPFVGLLSLNSNDITFVVRAWVKTEDYWDVFFKYNQLFYDELPKHGFGFAYPHMDVTLLTNNK